MDLGSVARSKLLESERASHERASSIRPSTNLVVESPQIHAKWATVGAYRTAGSS